MERVNATVDDVGDAASDALNGASQLGGAAVDAVSDVTAVVGEHASEAVNLIQDNAVDAFASIGEISSLYTSDMIEAKEEMMKVAGLLSDSCEQIIPLLKLEIFRDFSQIISVVFASVFVEVSGFMKDAKDTLGAIASSIAIDLGEAFRSFSAVLG